MTLTGAVQHFTPWSQEDLRTLATVYASGGIKAAICAFPTRSRSSLYHAAKRLGIQRRPRWTKREDQRLRTEWGSLSMNELARAFGRPRDGIYVRAQQLGLPLGCPDGYEYLSRAAERCGYDSTQLRRILRWAGVHVRESYSRTHGPHRSFHIVDPLDVDDAVAAWHRTETLNGAARRYGCACETIARRLRRMGVDPRKTSRRRNAHHRVETALIDRAMAGAA